MREIKFRVWDKHKKILSYILPRDFEWLGETVLDNERFVVQQFTGLKDKNGKEIYEGDIVQAYDNNGNKNGKPDEVKWEVFVGCYECNISHGFNTGGLYYYFDGKNPTPTCEVIGNIYENPELIKQS